MDRIIKKHPELEGKITLLDVATPHTMKRYTDSTRGAYMSFLFTHKNGMYNSNCKINGIKNLILSGQWTMSPGGVPFAIMSGYHSIQRVCKKENNIYSIFGMLLQSK